MFSLVHFSRSFPYIHPYLFPIQTPPLAHDATATDTSSPCHASVAKNLPVTAENASASAPASQVRHLKSLYRRHLRSHRNDTLTYSGVYRHMAW